MAPTDEESVRQKAQDDAANPFIAFRRFADEQMSKLISGIFGLTLPSSSSSTTSDRAFQDYQAWLQEARSSRESLQREAQEAERIMDVYTKAHKDSAQEELQKAVQDHAEPLRCPYRPDDQKVSQRQPSPPELSLAGFGHGLQHTILAAPLLGRQLSSVPVAYLIYSPYSPVQLEHHPILSKRGIHWREAFEDLLAVQNGEDLDRPREQDITSSKIEWVSRMIELAMCKRDRDYCIDRTTTAPWRHPHISDRIANERQSDNDADEGEPQQAHDEDRASDHDEQITELDLFNHFLGAQKSCANQEDSSDSQSQSRSRSIAHLQHDSAPTANDSGKPSILSTLTTTERTTLQDGTVHTKVVLKKRFSDGREESTETMHTQNPTSKPQYQPPTKAVEQRASGQDAADSHSRTKKAKGWFWS